MNDSSCTLVHELCIWILLSDLNMMALCWGMIVFSWIECRFSLKWVLCLFHNDYNKFISLLNLIFKNIISLHSRVMFMYFGYFCWKKLSLMSKEFLNYKGISDGICNKDGKTHERIQWGDQVRKNMIEIDCSILWSINVESWSCSWII